MIFYFKIIFKLSIVGHLTIWIPVPNIKNYALIFRIEDVYSSYSHSSQKIKINFSNTNYHIVKMHCILVLMLKVLKNEHFNLFCQYYIKILFLEFF